MNEAERREFLTQFIEKVEIYEEEQANGQWLKSIEFKLPIISKDMKNSLDNGSQIETEVLLSKGIDISAGKLRVEISVEDMDLSAAHGNASYNKIKKHVYEKTGLQVSNLNIAQVKRKYGIIERENYNLPKSENTKQPNCTPEKEKAIVAALQYFKMIG